MADEIDWERTTFEGNRRVQRQQFRALPLYEKLKIIEQINEVADLFAARRRDRTKAAGPQQVKSGPSESSDERG